MTDSAFPPVQFGEYPFPFVGAGEAQYFEWAEVHVVFERSPTRVEQAAITATVPPPLTDSVDFDDSFLMVASDQFAHATIAETYEADPGDAGLEEESDEDFGRFFFAASSQVTKFNADTERWLKEAHAICPILVAFRAEDWEAGGTELSKWHDWSIAQSDAILSNFDLAAADDDDHPGNFVLTRLIGVFVENERELPTELRDLVQPGEPELELLRAGDAAGLLAALQSREARLEPTIKRLVGAIENGDDVDVAAAASVISILESMDDPPTNAWRALATFAADADEPSLVDALCQAAAASTSGLSYIGYVAYQLMQKKRWQAAAVLFDGLVGHESSDLSIYNNALYGIMADNTGGDVQPERARKYIDAARPYGPRNPSIFYNIACAEMELGNEDAVLENVKLALEHGYEKPEQMRNEEVFGDLRQDPRFTALFDD